jgi:uncharacterized protein (DUF2141 family)
MEFKKQNTMKTLIYITLNLLLVLNLNAQEKSNLTITFEGISEIKGELFIGIYQKDNFLRQPTHGKTVAVKGETVDVTFENLAHGEYAVSVFHDLNGNQQFDMDEYGAPAEPWVMSGSVNPNAMPVFEDAKIHLKEETQSLTLSF